MNYCAKCLTPITVGTETWVRQKRGQDKVPLCERCSLDVRQAIQEAAVPLDLIALQAKAAVGSAADTPIVDIAVSPQIKAPRTQPYSTIYQPSGRVPLLGGVALALSSLVGGILLGGLTAIVGQYIYLIFIFPAVIGYMGGHIVSQGVRWGKVRSPAAAALGGLLIGIISYAAFRYGEYLLFQNQARMFLMSEGYSAAEIRSDLAAFVDMALRSETGRGGLWGFILLQAKEGMSLGRIGQESALNIGPFLTWVYWLLEAGLVVGLSRLVARESAWRPFCEFHNRWYEKARCIGGVSVDKKDAMVEAVRSGAFTWLKDALTADPTPPGIELSAARCHNCQDSDQQLTVQKVTRDARGRRKAEVLLQQMVAPVQGEMLTAAGQK